RAAAWACRSGTPDTVRVAVVVEQAWDPASIEVDARGAVDWARAVPAPSPGSLEAVELALGLGETHVFGLGARPEPLLRDCLARGAAAATAAPDVYARVPALADYDLLLAPHRSGDHGVSPVAALLAGLLDLPQATAVETLSLAEAEATVIRRLDRGEREELAVPLPAGIAVEPGIAPPRPGAPAALSAPPAA